MLAVTPRTIRNYLKQGILQGRKIGGQWRFDDDDLAALLNREPVSRSIREAHEKTLYDFIENETSGKEGEIRSASVIKLFLPKDRAERAIREIAESLPSQSSGGYRFHADYAESEGCLRFTLTASASELRKILETIESFGK